MARFMKRNASAASRLQVAGQQVESGADARGGALAGVHRRLGNVPILLQPFCQVVDAVPLLTNPPGLGVGEGREPGRDITGGQLRQDLHIEHDVG
jgi:hypothetical protein